MAVDEAELMRMYDPSLILSSYLSMNRSKSLVKETVPQLEEVHSLEQTPGTTYMFNISLTGLH